MQNEAQASYFEDDLQNWFQINQSMQGNEIDN